MNAKRIEGLVFMNVRPELVPALGNRGTAEDRVLLKRINIPFAARDVFRERGHRQHSKDLRRRSEFLWQGGS